MLEYVKNCFTLIVLFFLSTAHAFSQDLIVTVRQDSINCSILEQTTELVRFFLASKPDSVQELKKGEISTLAPGYYTQKSNTMVHDTTKMVEAHPVKVEIPLHGTTLADTLLSWKKLPKWQFGFYGGLGYRLNRSRIGMSKAALNYHKKLRSGVSFGLDAGYFPCRKIGIGWRYDTYFSTGTRDARNKDNIMISFLGSGLLYRAPLKFQKTSVLTGFWLGYQPFRNNAVVDGVDTRLSANTMAWGISIGLEQRIGKKCAVSLSGQCFLSSSYKLKREVGGTTEVITFSSDRFEDLSRASLTLGLKFN
ncbi:hypothetical protein DYBT9275_03302 [Dyadobacter sp. CECT 9275]|uniref:Outer membrane protein beta-barrel domain-containing protein n=1 Tax=Dyadobacter helix TaxID=2822344 RepID=A0A916JDQ1_9BACT|nr:hypothetical protein [Dyadobacter sp. CECT 9275]CAG5004119.1 hypothetical protein DYBT9275_03302 [Dyadobacter sp. CECT 9275]